jgi:hypothetical protein
MCSNYKHYKCLNDKTNEREQTKIYEQLIAIDVIRPSKVQMRF